LWEDTSVWYLLRILQFCSVVAIAIFFYRYLNVKVTEYERPTHLHAGLCVQEEYHLKVAASPGDNQRNVCSDESWWRRV